jgi:prolyl-tRNA editing enzyme YbaK/EbsC (Cys-tRNA(Pro) deacylase)
LLVLTSGAHRVDTAKVAAHVGTGNLARAKAEFVRYATGQTIGGVAPIGHPQRIRTLIDVDLEKYPQIWAAGGIPHAVFPATYSELLGLTAAEPVEVA